MKNRETITIILTAIYLLLLIVSIQHNQVRINLVTAPFYIGRHSLTNK